MQDRSPPWLPDVARIAGEAYFVGGCVRDWLMGRPLKDIDLVVSTDPWQTGKALADALGAHLFWLRQEQQVARVLRPGRDAFQVDLSPLTGPIEEDLRARDFTVNAMAVPLASGLREGAPLLDPSGGQVDLRHRRLRLVGAETLARDPLRLMRAVRLSEQLRFRLETETEARVREAAPTLARVSPERVRDELFLMLAGPRAAPALVRLRAYGLLLVFLPEAAEMAAAPWAWSVGRVRRLQTLSASRTLPASDRRRLREAVTEPRPRWALLKWAAVLAGLAAAAGGREAARYGTDLARQSVSRLRLSAREGALLAAVLREEPAAAGLLRRGETAGRAMHRFVCDAGGWATEAVLFAASAVDGAGEGTPGTLANVLAGVAREEAALAAPLLSGSEVMAHLGLPAGPAVGEWLAALAEARAEGRVTTRDEARAWLTNTFLTAEAQRTQRKTDD